MTKNFASVSFSSVYHKTDGLMLLVKRKLPLILAITRDTHNRGRKKISGQAYPKVEYGVRSQSLFRPLYSLAEALQLSPSTRSWAFKRGRYWSA
jgi:hypothetical protein